MRDDTEVPAEGPLAGIRVIDASNILAGPLTCQFLGDFGADVIKLEHPEHGDGIRGHGHSKDGVPLWWKHIARNKRTVGLYLGDAEGAAIFRQLAGTADVVVENFRPGTLERWDVGYDQLAADHPGLIMLRVTGFGQEGPYADRPGFGTLAESMSGFAYATGQPDGPPTLPPFGLADSIAAMAGAHAVTMALYHRDARGGTGQQIDMSILEPIIATLGPAPSVYEQLGRIQERTGNRSTNNAPRNVYRTADDRWIAVSSSATPIAERILRLVGHPEVIEEPWFSSGRGRAEHADLLDGYVARWVAERSREQVLQAFSDAGAAAAPVYNAAELLEDPHVVARDVFPTVDDPDLGPMRTQNVPFRMSGTPGRIRFTGRGLGADTDAVLVEELGLDPARVDALRARGVVR